MGDLGDTGFGERLLNAIGEVKRELEAHGIKLEAIQLQTTKTNGRVSVLEEWRRMQQEALAADAGFQRGYKARRSDDLEKLERARSIIDDWWPVGLGVAVGVSAAWAYVVWPL